jgi:hypothetical protein
VILGGNILNLALSRIGTDTITYYQYVSRVNNASGIKVASYAAPVPMQGSMQAVPHTMLAMLGLDLGRDYAMFYTQSTVNDLERNSAPDQYSYGGHRYEVVSNTDWNMPQGFTGVLAVRIA